MQDIKEFVGTMKRKEFLADEKTMSAVAFKIENIGEASKNIPKQIKAKYKDLPWTEMARMRDKITHFYFGIDYKVVWAVVKKELPAIEPAIIKLKPASHGRNRQITERLKAFWCLPSTTTSEAEPFPVLRSKDGKRADFSLKPHQTGPFLPKIGLTGHVLEIIGLRRASTFPTTTSLV